VADETAGDPCGPCKWVRQSLRHLRATLVGIGVFISHVSVARLLKQQKYSLKANRKAIARTQHPQRDQQFRYIQRVKRRFIQAGHPVISVDTKKKELIGNFKNTGATWCQHAEPVNDHDFAQDAVARAVPYGIYDVVHNQGDVYVGTSGDTADFAVDAIERWYRRTDRPRFADESKPLPILSTGRSPGDSRVWDAGLS
jgi:hypothetical protein